MVMGYSFIQTHFQGFSCFSVYSNRVTAHKGMFYQTIDDFADVKDMPRQILNLIADNKYVQNLLLAFDPSRNKALVSDIILYKKI